jgi:hypothetical protein
MRQAAEIAEMQAQSGKRHDVLDQELAITGYIAPESTKR